MTTMKLYYHPLSPYSQKALIALYEKNAAFTPEIVDTFNPEKRAEYTKMYPLGKVTLLADGDRFIPESSILVEYLDGAIRGGARL